MKTFITFLSGVILMLSACKKEPANTNETEKPETAEAVTVLNGAKTQGNMPASSISTAPVIRFYNAEIKTGAGKYAILTAGLDAGSPAGFYVQVDGSNHHFKVDLTQGTTQYKPYVVLRIPEKTKTGIFSVQLRAYDASNNVSDSVGYRISVETLADGGTEGMAGTWKLTAEKHSNIWDTNVYDTIHSQYASINCTNNQLGTFHMSGDPYPTVHTAVYRYLNRKRELTLAASGALSEAMVIDGFTIDYQASTCNNVVYKSDPPSSTNAIINHHWVYNRTANTISRLYHIELKDTLDYFSLHETFQVISKTATKFVIRDSYDNAEYEYTRL